MVFALTAWKFMPQSSLWLVLAISTVMWATTAVFWVADAQARLTVHPSLVVLIQALCDYGGSNEKETGP
jgi:hypothetical protein